MHYVAMIWDKDTLLDNLCAKPFKTQEEAKEWIAEHKTEEQDSCIRGVILQLNTY